MIFDSLLEKIVSRLKTARAVLLLDKDGISVAEWKRQGDSLDAISISIEYSRLLLDGLHISSELNDGALKELILKLEKSLVFFAPASTGYYVVLILENDSELGLARYLTRQVIPQIKNEL